MMLRRFSIFDYMADISLFIITDVFIVLAKTFY